MDYKVKSNFLNDLLLKLLILFVFIILVVAFWQPFFDPFGPSQLIFIRVFIPLIIIYYLIININSKQITVKINPLLLPLTGYIIFSFISVFFALNKEISLKYFI